MKVYIKTLNICPMRRVNIFKYKEALKNSGHVIVESAEEADKILVWTCAVRDDFHDNSISVLKKFEDEGYKVIAAGCLPSINPLVIKNEFGGEIIHYNNDKEEFYRIFKGDIDSADYPVAEAPITIDLEEYKKQNPNLKIANDDQYIKLFISEGCTRKCSYCTEIKAFPKYRSYPMQKIIKKAKQLVERTGVKKIALFGDDIGAYGVDTGRSLIELIEALTSFDDEVKISLKQINPIYLMQNIEKFKNIIDSKKIFQMLVPIQSSNNRILSLMKREYSGDDLELLFDSIKENNDLELETHIIAGFPSETREEWEETVNFIKKYKFKYVMGNIYMAGMGTEAADMDYQISSEEKERRIISGAYEIEKLGTVVGHNLSWRAKEHITHEKIDFTEL